MVLTQLTLQGVFTSEAARKRLHGWQLDCATVLDEPATSSQAADDQNQASAAPEPGYLFEGQLSQVSKQGIRTTCPLHCLKALHAAATPHLPVQDAMAL